MKPEVVLFRTDASSVIGEGHAMRCLTLADVIAQRGGRCVFIAAEMTPSMCHAIIGAGHRLHMIDPDGAPAQPNWEASLLPVTRQSKQAAATAAIAARENATHLVIDHYRLDRRFVEHRGLASLRTLAIDDRANRSIACDLLLDQTVGRDPSSYSKIAPGADLLIGGRFALLRPQFASSRAAALERRMQPGSVERLLVSLGSTDLGGITGRVLTALMESSYRGKIDVVLGHAAQSRQVVEMLAATTSRIALHTGVEDMAALMVVADLAIGAAGMSAWERCALGLPTLALVLADNQRLVADVLASTGAAVLVADTNRLGDYFYLLSNRSALAEMSAAAFGLIDGNGAARVADAFLKRPIMLKAKTSVRLRPAIAEDSERIWLWRNDPDTRKHSRSYDPILRQNHDRWFTASLASKTRQIWIAERDRKPVASTRVDREGKDGFISIMVSPDARGTGVGSEVLAAICALWDEIQDGQLRAVIHGSNAASIRIFSRCGFEPEGEALPDEFRNYVRSSF